MWKVILEPEGKNPGTVTRKKGFGQKVKEAIKPPADAAEATETVPENTGGMVVYISNGSGVKQEVSRVAYVRREGVCKNPAVSYQDQLDQEVAKAEASVAKINETLTAAEPGVLQ